MAFQTALRLTANFWARASPEKYVPRLASRASNTRSFTCMGSTSLLNFVHVVQDGLGALAGEEARDQARQQQDGGIEGDGSRPRHPDGHGQLPTLWPTAPSILMTQMMRRSMRGFSRHMTTQHSTPPAML